MADIDRPADPVRVGKVWVPKTFQLNVMDPGWGEDPEDPLVIELLYSVGEDGAIDLTGVLSSPIEVQEAIQVLKRTKTLDEWKRTALMYLAADQVEEARKLLDRVEGRHTPYDDPDYMKRVGDAMREAGRAPVRRQRNRITPAHLRDVAQVYREAWRRGSAPTKAVSQHFGVSHSTAARWVGLAREAGDLGPADGSRGGEAEDVELGVDYVTSMQITHPDDVRNMLRNARDAANEAAEGVSPIDATINKVLPRSDAEKRDDG